MGLEAVDSWPIEFGDFPGGTSSAMVCAYPDAIDGGMDIALPVHCSEHGRTIWWCLNMAVLWCDGGPPRYEYHTWPR